MISCQVFKIHFVVPAVNLYHKNVQPKEIEKSNPLLGRGNDLAQCTQDTMGQKNEFLGTYNRSFKTKKPQIKSGFALLVHLNM